MKENTDTEFLNYNTDDDGFDYDMYMTPHFKESTEETCEEKYVPVSMVKVDDEEIYDSIFKDLFRVQA